MRRLFILLLASPALAGSLEDFENTPDCDNEFAGHALALIQSKLGDVPRLHQIEGILFSCNKGIVQKLTEASVHLLHKGVIPTQLTEELQHLAASQKKAKIEKLKKIEGGLDSELREVVQFISSISGNDSLSGNEKLMSISGRILQLTRENRQRLREAFQPKTLPIQKVVEPISIPEKPLPAEHFTPKLYPVIVTPNSEPHKVKLNISLPSSFPISTKENRPDEEESLLFRSKPSSSILPTDAGNLPDVPPSSRVGPNVPSVFVKTDPGISRNFAVPSNQLFHKEEQQPLGPPISALILNNGRPVTVGEVQKQENKNIEDLDLLKSRNSIWAEAAKFLDQANIPQQFKKFIEQHALRNGVLKGNPDIIAGLNIPANTFPLPAAAYEQLSKAFSTGKIGDSLRNNNENRRYLPNRQRDAIIPEIRYRGLDRFDSHVGRFDKGVGKEHRIELPTSGIPESLPTYIKNEALVKPAITKQNERSVQTTRFFGRTNEETEKSSVIGNEMERKELFGVPSFHRGVPEFPTYPPPPPAITTTTVSSGSPAPVNENTADKFPSFPSINVQLPSKSVDLSSSSADKIPAFVPYNGPEEITGSRLHHNRNYNVETGGRRRFVKMDILNEH